MLLELAVRNLALIERARITLAPGLSVVTGETGAGKSLLVDALALVMGGRADASLVRHAAHGARVEAVFERLPEPLICVREVAAGGRSVARIDDETVTVGRLAATVGPLVELHGQHEQQRLLLADWQRDALDAHAAHASLRAAVAEAVRSWQANEAALRELAHDPADLARRIELAEHAAEEIEAARLREGETAELRARLATIANAERIAALLAEAHAEVAGEAAGARDRLARAARAVGELAQLEPAFATLAERLDGLQAEADDMALELRRRLESFADESRDGTDLEERLSLLYELMRKYGADERAVVEYGAGARAEAERLRGHEDERRRRTADSVRLESAARQAAEQLTDGRRRAAGALAEAVSARLLELGFPGQSFAVELAPAPLSESGADSVTFTLAPNPGEPARPLSRIASGGELSRVALALKVVLAGADQTPTLVFDEVDAGIGGRSADPLGRALWQLARDHQVICVTHLPQIAAYADAHLRIRKLAREGRTLTEIDSLEGDERRAELAQMLGGSAGDSGALAAASELLERGARLRATPAGAVR